MKPITDSPPKAAENIQPISAFECVSSAALQAFIQLILEAINLWHTIEAFLTHSSWRLMNVTSAMRSSINWFY